MNQHNNSANITIKGTNDSLLITLGQGNWKEIQELLLCRLQEKENFFCGAKIILDVGEHALRAPELNDLIEQLSKKGLTVKNIYGKSPSTMMNAKMLGLTETIEPANTNNTENSLTNRGISQEPATFLHKNLRAGYKIAVENHVVVIGDVNPDAEIIAGGSVVIWGRLLGSVQAGHPNDPDAVVCALEMNPTLLKIAGIQAALERNIQPSSMTQARIQQGQIMFKPWRSDTPLR